MIRKFIHFSFLFVGCFYALSSNVKAQSSNLSISLIGYTFDTVNLGYTLTMNAEITNLDTLPFSGNINFGLRNNSGIISNTSVFDKPPYSGDSIFLPGRQTVPAIFGVYISPQYFTPGPDVVVVWPICTAPTTDSIIVHVFVQDPSAITGPGAGIFSYVVLHDKIMFSYPYDNFGFEQVRIFDAFGQLVFATEASDIPQIPIGQLAKGLYICQIISNGALKLNFKFAAQ